MAHEGNHGRTSTGSPDQHGIQHVAHGELRDVLGGHILQFPGRSFEYPKQWRNEKRAPGCVACIWGMKSYGIILPSYVGIIKKDPRDWYVHNTYMNFQWIVEVDFHGKWR